MNPSAAISPALRPLMAAMYRALPTGQTRISKNGYAIILSTPVYGRQDIPGDHIAAAAWLQRADITTTNITDADIAAWATWYDDVHDRRRISGARILITSPHSVVRGREAVPANSVKLIDGWGDEVCQATVLRVECYDPTALNNMRTLGAYLTRQNTDAIARVIASIRADYPEFSGAPVQNNDTTLTHQAA